MDSLITPIPPGPGPWNLPSREEAGAWDWSRSEELFTWHRTGRLNLAHEAVDRHVAEGRGDKVALVYVDEDREVRWTFRQLRDRSDQYAALLRHQGLKTGDRVFIFLPKIPELYAALLGTIKAGAVAGPLFEAFYADALRDRLGDCGARFLITDRDLGSRVPYADLPDLSDVWVLETPFPATPAPEDARTRLGNARPRDPASLGLSIDHPGAARFHSLEEGLAALGTVEPGSATQWVDRDDGLIIHYTSGSTGKPKGILHAHRAMIQHAQTGRWVLDLRDDDVYWCTAHPGWVTGSSYGVFAPWLNGATVVSNGGRFDAQTWYGLIERLGITVWYSAPTAFRMLLGAGDEVLRSFKTSSLRHILSVGEPLNPELVTWAHERFGVRIHDTWWMTETGAQLIANLPSDPIHPGSMGRPLPGIQAVILGTNGQELPRGQVGQLAIRAPWPSIMKTVWNNPAKYQSYFVDVEGLGPCYISGDSAKMSDDGRVWFQGRDDDLIVASGEKVSPFEVESTLIEHPAVAEAGVIGKPDAVRGSVVKAFVVLREGHEPSPRLAKEIQGFVKTRLSAHAYPREVEILAALPKTRVSGKIMRRVLKAWETGTPVGDTTTLETDQRLTLALG